MLSPSLHPKYRIPQWVLFWAPRAAKCKCICVSWCSILGTCNNFFAGLCAHYIVMRSTKCVWWEMGIFGRTKFMTRPPFFGGVFLQTGSAILSYASAVTQRLNNPTRRRRCFSGATFKSLFRVIRVKSSGLRYARNVRQTDGGWWWWRKLRYELGCFVGWVQQLRDYMEIADCVILT